MEAINEASETNSIMNLSHKLFVTAEVKALCSILYSSGNTQIKYSWGPADPPLSYIKLATTSISRGSKPHQFSRSVFTSSLFSIKWILYLPANFSDRRGFAVFQIAFCLQQLFHLGFHNIFFLFFLKGRHQNFFVLDNVFCFRHFYFVVKCFVIQFVSLLLLTILYWRRTYDYLEHVSSYLVHVHLKHLDLCGRIFENHHNY